MKKFGFGILILSGVILILLAIFSICFAAGIIEIGGGKVDSSGFSYTPITKTDSAITGAETGKTVWTPASGNKIVLLGIKFSSDTATPLLIEMNSTSVVPVTECTASGQVVVGNGTPIWQGGANETLTYTTGIAGRHSILMWGYEK